MFYRLLKKFKLNLLIFDSSEYFYIFAYFSKVFNPITAALSWWLCTKVQNKVAYFHCLKGKMQKIKQDREAEQFLAFLVRQS